ncbi:predicted protein [Sclerotinia sclerotiorum 1980 UF-70]|uniref:Uncharacterized protein n=1 Tax=Sclerotinia sclerotiorum (strain ATCC 18683 / 1980 / Ss-1) TaxID=665079 RepID=A7EAA4_SCLS1|nr:predicted protein [Sclerotinia sclerotiorum 1980 UF-70]EDN99382.1 predicted protein [Sclerotinia sclerotiorum 1980 UF-70]
MATIIAIKAPVDNCTPPLEVPDAPASLSTPLLPAELAASPADGSLGAEGSEVASAEKNDATELEDMAGVSDIEVVEDGVSVVDDWGEFVLDIDVETGLAVEVTKELCAEILPKRKKRKKKVKETRRLKMSFIMK